MTLGRDTYDLADYSFPPNDPVNLMVYVQSGGNATDYGLQMSFIASKMLKVLYVSLKRKKITILFVGNKMPDAWGEWICNLGEETRTRSCGSNNICCDNTLETRGESLNHPKELTA